MFSIFRLSGGYANLTKGPRSESLIALTGGVVEEFEVDRQPEFRVNAGFDLIMHEFQQQTLMLTRIKVIAGQTEARTPEGLFRGHTYGITGVAVVPLERASFSDFFR